MRKPFFAAALTALLATGAAAASPMDLTIIDRAVAEHPAGPRLGAHGVARVTSTVWLPQASTVSVR